MSGRISENTSRLVRLSMFTAIALTIFILEAQIPSPFFYIPGMKLGLANVVTVFLLYRYKKTDALAVLLVRIILGSFFAGQMISLIYSLSGGLLSLGAMIVCTKLPTKESVWFTGVAGGAVHNIGQLCAAAAVMQTSAVFSYIPYLVIAGIAAGLFCGIAAAFFLKHTDRISRSHGREKRP